MARKSSNRVESLDNVVVTEEQIVQLYDANAKTWREKHLPAKETAIITSQYQWQNPKNMIQRFLLDSNFEVLRQQFADAGKTGVYYLESEKLFGQYGFSDPIQWDNVWLAENGKISHPKVGQIEVGVKAVFSAKPAHVDFLDFYANRFWCGNGSYHSMISHRVNFTDIKIEKPSQNLLTQAIEKHIESLPAPTIIEAEILDDRLTRGKRATEKALQNTLILFDDYLVKEKRGAELAEMPNQVMTNTFKPLVNAPDWFRSDLKHQFELMIEAEDFKDRGLITLDIQNAVTNVINHGGKEEKRDKRAYLDNNSPAMVKALSTFLAFQ